MENGIIKLNLVLYLPNVNVMLTWIDKQKGRCARVDCLAIRTQKKKKYVHGVQTQIFPNQMAKIRNKVFLWHLLDEVKIFSRPKQIDFSYINQN